MPNFQIIFLEREYTTNKSRRERLSKAIARLDSWLMKNKKQADPRTVQKVRNKVDDLSKRWFDHYRIEASCRRGIKLYNKNRGK